MDILSGFESLPDAVSRFCSDFSGFGITSTIFKDHSCGCKCCVNPSCLGSRSFLRASPTSHHRIFGRMLLLTFLGLLLLLVDFICWCWIPWFPSLGSRPYGQTLMFFARTQWLSGGIFSKQSDLLSYLLRVWFTCNHSGQRCASTHSKKSKFLQIYSAHISRHFQVM